MGKACDALQLAEGSGVPPRGGGTPSWPGGGVTGSQDVTWPCIFPRSSRASLYPLTGRTIERAWLDSRVPATLRNGFPSAGEMGGVLDLQEFSVVLEDLGVTIPLPGEGRDDLFGDFPFLLFPGCQLLGTGGRCEVGEERRAERSLRGQGLSCPEKGDC